MSAAVVDLDRERKNWTTLVASACLKGVMLWRSDPADGTQRFFAGRNGLVVVLPDTTEVQRFIERMA